MSDPATGEHGADGLGVDWVCDHCRKGFATSLDDEPTGWLVDEDADLYLCETCRTTSALATACEHGVPLSALSCERCAEPDAGDASEPLSPARTKPTHMTVLAGIKATTAADEKARERRLPWGAP